VGRKTRRPVFKVRRRKPGKVFGSKFSLSRGNGGDSQGRILFRRKVSFEELNRICEFSPFDPDALLKEFREAERLKGGLS